MTTYQDFIVSAEGDNLNGGTGPAATPRVSYAGGAWAAPVFTPAEGNPITDGVVPGDWVSLNADAATGDSGYNAAVVSRDATTITLDVGAGHRNFGTQPGNGSGITCRVGGHFAGPAAASAFPLTLIDLDCLDADGNFPRLLLPASAFTVSAGIVCAQTGPFRIEAYTTTPGDGLGMFTLQSDGTALVPLTLSGTTMHIHGITVTNSGTSGSNAGIVCTGEKNVLENAYVHAVQGIGVDWSGSRGHLVRCAVTAANGAETTSIYGFYLHPSASHVYLDRCIAWSNPGSGCDGFTTAGGSITFRNCIAAGNGRAGWRLGYEATFVGCDAYDNAADGVNAINTSAHCFEFLNSNFAGNAGYGMNGSGSGGRFGYLRNCGFGGGAFANGLGNTTGLKSIQESGSVDYPGHPWRDPDNLDFTLVVREAMRGGDADWATVAALANLRAGSRAAIGAAGAYVGGRRHRHYW